jgi:hypothetical protein
MKTFTDYAEEKLFDLYKNHDHEVGSELKKLEPEKYKHLKSTDCITYALNVISYAFKNIADESSAKRVWALGKKGSDLARYLVNNHGWKGIYINPDLKHPLDASAEHVYTGILAEKKCQYYDIPLSFKVVNYFPTPTNHPAFKKLNKSVGATHLNTLDITSLNSVRFGFGLSRGGRHTWIFSRGNVYEVHWAAVGKDLYEETPLNNFGWLSGAMVIPVDQAAMVSASAKLKCGN